MITAANTGYPERLPMEAISKAQMIARGADGHLSTAKERYIPLQLVDGREPTPGASDDEGYVKGRQIKTPIEVQFNKDEGVYYLYGGNHRVTQAELNGDRYIWAFVEPDRGLVGREATTLLSKTDLERYNLTAMDKYPPLETPRSGDELKKTLETPGYSMLPLNEVAKKPALQRRVRDEIKALSSEYPPTTKSSMYFPAVLTQEGLLSLAPDRIGRQLTGRKVTPVQTAEEYLDAMVRIADTYGLACIVRKMDVGQLSEALIGMLKRNGFTTYMALSEAGENKPSWIRPSKDGKVNRHTLLFSVIGKTEVAELSIGAKHPGNQNSLGQSIVTTETALNNFKQWFGDSKSVDRNGRPYVFYHGTSLEGYNGTTDIQKFDKSKVGDRFAADKKGFFFVNSPTIANYYAKSDRDYYTPGAGQGAVYPAYLRTLNPLIVDDAFLAKQRMDRIGKSEDVVTFWDNYQSLILKWAAKVKADSVLLKDNTTKVNGEPTVMAVVFDPKQIKSATGNKGTFSPNSADITAGINDTVSLPAQPRVQPDVELGKEILKLQEDADRIGNPYTSYEDAWTERETGSGVSFDLNVDTPAERFRNATPAPAVRNPVLNLAPRVTPTEDTSRLVKEQMPAWKFGVIYETMDNPTVSELMRDIINVLSLVPAGHRLCIVTPNPNEMIAAFKGRFDIDFASPEVGSEVWKGYYTNKKPDAVPGTRIDFWKRVVPVKKSEVTMTPAGENLVPELPVKPEVLVPNGITPATRPVPPRTPAILVPQFFGFF